MLQLFASDKFDDYIVRIANEEDIGKVLQLLKNAAFWLKEKGVNQWEYLRNGGENEEIIQDILAGTTFLVNDSKGELAATFNLSPKQNSWDIAMWGDRDDNAYYLHRLAVGKGYHNSQLGKKLIRWIDTTNLLNDGYIRLDCVGDNKVLNRFYTEAGYTFAGHTGEGDDKFCKYEKAFKE